MEVRDAHRVIIFGRLVTYLAKLERAVGKAVLQDMEVAVAGTGVTTKDVFRELFEVRDPTSDADMLQISFADLELQQAELEHWNRHGRVTPEPTAAT
ncbi:hypothetical protein HK104_000622 [Borealophlyctis nickersoniae]|nr:hypothetical protein HK104_000622 [Borealophlyctis nickersoniae]